MNYPLWIILGIVLGLITARMQRDDRPDLGPARPLLALAAVIGAVGGAFLFELPADLLGWAWRPVAAPKDMLPLGGRTVLGGLLGGWLSVEAAKLRLGIRGPTGDAIALPLAIALACGRIGCVTAGCCAGTTCAPDAWWRAVAIPDASGSLRFPAPAVEALFHAMAALGLAICASQGWLRGCRLAAYLSMYAALRFALEWVRGNPPIFLGLDYYQFLAIALGALAGGTWLSRYATARSIPPQPTQTP